MAHSLRLEILAHTFTGPLRIAASGCLTEDNIAELAQMLQRGASSHSYPDLCVALSRVGHREPAAVEALEVCISQHNAAGGAPSVGVELGTLAPGSMGGPTVSQQCSHTAAEAPTGLDRQPEESAAPSPQPVAAEVAEMISPLTASIGITQSLREAAERLNPAEAGLIVENLSYEPVGFLPADHLRRLIDSVDCGWQTELCASLMQSSAYQLRPEHTLEAVLQQYHHEGARTRSVYEQHRAVGLLHPEVVQRWREDHDPALSGKPAQQSLMPAALEGAK